MAIIDKTKAEFKDLPDILDGEVLLGTHVDVNGNVLGWHTCPKEIAKYMTEIATPKERQDCGYERFQSVLDGIRPALVADTTIVAAKALVTKPGKKLAQ